MAEANTPKEAAISIEERAKDFYRSTRPSGQLTDTEYTDIKNGQIKYLKETAVEFLESKRAPKLTPFTFTAVQLADIQLFYEFYAVKISELGWRDELQNRLNAFYNEFAEPVIEVDVSFVCAVKHRSQWYRGTIEKITTEPNGSKQCIILLFDFGRFVRKSQTNLAVLSGVFIHTPPIAMRCQFAHLNPDHRKNVRNMATRKELQARLTELVENKGYGLLYWLTMNEPAQVHSYQVSLFSDWVVKPETLFDGAYILSETYAAFDRAKIPISNAVCKEWINRPIHEWDYDDIQYGDRIRVNIAHVVSAAEIYVQYADDLKKVTNIRQQIDQYVNEQNNEFDDSIQWAVGDLCLVRAQNPNTQRKKELWYRGRITDIDNDTANVFLRDWGMSTMTKPELLRTIPSHLDVVGDLAKKCYIHKCKELTCATCISVAIDVIGSYRYFEMSIVRSDDDAMGISLWATNSVPIIGKNIAWNNTAASILSQAIVIGMSDFIRVSQQAYHKEQRGNDAFKYSLRHGIQSAKEPEQKSKSASRVVPMAVESWPPATPCPLLDFNGHIMNLNKEGIFFIQCNAKHSQCRALSHKITEYITANREWIEEYSRDHDWQVGDACFGSLYGDEYYNRATIEYIDHDRCICMVKYVDYGAYQRCHLDDLLVATAFGDISILVNQYYIPEIVAVNPNGEWHKSIWAGFVDRFVGQKCHVIVEHDSNKPIVPCSLFVQSPSNDGNILTWMENDQLFLGVEHNQNCNFIVFV